MFSWIVYVRKLLKRFNPSTYNNLVTIDKCYSQMLLQHGLLSVLIDMASFLWSSVCSLIVFRIFGHIL